MKDFFASKQGIALHAGRRFSSFGHWLMVKANRALHDILEVGREKTTPASGVVLLEVACLCIYYSSYISLLSCFG